MGARSNLFPIIIAAEIDGVTRKARFYYGLAVIDTRQTVTLSRKRTADEERDVAACEVLMANKTLHGHVTVFVERE